MQEKSRNPFPPIRIFLQESKNRTNYPLEFAVIESAVWLHNLFYLNTKNNTHQVL